MGSSTSCVTVDYVLYPCPWSNIQKKNQNQLTQKLVTKWTYGTEICIPNDILGLINTFFDLSNPVKGNVATLLDTNPQIIWNIEKGKQHLFEEIKRQFPKRYINLDMNWDAYSPRSALQIDCSSINVNCVSESEDTYQLEAPKGPIIFQQMQTHQIVLEYLKHFDLKLALSSFTLLEGNYQAISSENEKFKWQGTPKELQSFHFRLPSDKKNLKRPEICGEDLYTIIFDTIAPLIVKEDIDGDIEECDNNILKIFRKTGENERTILHLLENNDEKYSFKWMKMKFLVVLDQTCSNKINFLL